MILGSVLKIETKKFPILEGESEEIVNDNMYGKALCQYLHSQLPKVGIAVPNYLPEDWGWWLEVEDAGFKMGLCIYSHPEVEGDPEQYCIMPSIHSEKIWVWSKFRKVDVSQNVLKIINVLENIFLADSEIIHVTRHDDFPY